MTELTTLQTKRLQLRKLSLLDIPSLVKQLNDPSMSRYTLTLPYPYTDDDGRYWITKVHTDEAENSAMTWAIDNGTLVGVIELKLDFSSNESELAYWVGREFQGKGYATEAASAVLEYAKGHQLPPVISFCYPQNLSSCKVLQNVGFIRHGKTQKDQIDLVRFELPRP